MYTFGRMSCHLYESDKPEIQTQNLQGLQGLHEAMDVRSTDQFIICLVHFRYMECIGIHTCDRRRTKSWIHEAYPDYEIEAGFTENDELWEADTRESMDAHIVRIRKLLTDIFEGDTENVVSLTARSGAIRALYAATGHREVWVGAGVMVPVFIRADLVN
ncbi:hypothetical protein VMCG_09858 [Cytospora schulzeri]|uniref:Uncharacterized protein n=1 Tax=Cytospora schulzeri TaxID=448051 RepID=A0A423VDY9_9PEZI|nr:hypothetical protein VMCG_09858 [Valsa malicola]